MVQVLIVMLLAIPLMGMFTNHRTLASNVEDSTTVNTFTPPEDGVPGRREGGGTR